MFGRSFCTAITRLYSIIRWGPGGGAWRIQDFPQECGHFLLPSIRFRAQFVAFCHAACGRRFILRRKKICFIFLLPRLKRDQFFFLKFESRVRMRLDSKALRDIPFYQPILPGEKPNIIIILSSSFFLLSRKGKFFFSRMRKTFTFWKN